MILAQRGGHFRPLLRRLGLSSDGDSNPLPMLWRLDLSGQCCCDSLSVLRGFRDALPRAANPATVLAKKSGMARDMIVRSDEFKILEPVVRPDLILVMDVESGRHGAICRLPDDSVLERPSAHSRRGLDLDVPVIRQSLGPYGLGSRHAVILLQVSKG